MQLQSLESTRFYRVALSCEAVPDIGCGIRAKPILTSLEAHPAIAAAWISRSGTLLAVSWGSAAEQTEQPVASAFRGEDCICLDQVTDTNEHRSLFSSLLQGDGWYRGSEVDQLSSEEASVIAARVVRRMTDEAKLDLAQTTHLTEVIGKAVERVLSTGPGHLSVAKETAGQRDFRCGTFDPYRRALPSAAGCGGGRWPSGLTARAIAKGNAEGIPLSATHRQTRSGAAASLILHRWTRNRAVAAKDTAVARLRLEPEAARGAFMEEHAGIGRHRFLAGRTTPGTSNRGFENGIGHCLISVAGYPASVTAFMKRSGVALSDSYRTTARLVLRATCASRYPGTRWSAFFTVMGQSEQFIPGTSNTACSGSA